MAGIQFPSILAGQVFSAGLLLSMLEWTAMKQSDTSRASTTTLTADPDLSFAVPSAGSYKLEGYLNYEGGTGGSSDLQIEMNSIGTLRYDLIYQGSGGSNNVAVTVQGGSAVSLRTNGAGVLCAALIRGSVITPSSGTTSLSWAQNTSSATATIIHAGSWLSLRRVA